MITQNKELITKDLVDKVSNAVKALTEFYELLDNPQPRQEEWEVVEYTDYEAWSDVPGLPLICQGHHRWNIAAFKNFPIYKVRRLSDSVVLEVGKEYEMTYEEGKGFRDTITRFDIKDGFLKALLINTDWFSLINFPKSITEVKPNPVLFTMEEILGIVRQMSSNANGYDNKHFINRKLHELAESKKGEPEKYDLAIIREALIASGSDSDWVDGLLERVNDGLSKIKSKEV